MLSKNLRQTSALCNTWIGKIVVGMEKAAAEHTRCEAVTEVSLDLCEGSTIISLCSSNFSLITKISDIHNLDRNAFYFS